MFFCLILDYSGLFWSNNLNILGKPQKVITICFSDLVDVSTTPPKKMLSLPSGQAWHYALHLQTRYRRWSWVARWRWKIMQGQVTLMLLLLKWTPCCFWSHFMDNWPSAGAIKSANTSCLCFLFRNCLASFWRLCSDSVGRSVVTRLGTCYKPVLFLTVSTKFIFSIGL